ncbi:MAG: hypothetical protein OXT64_00610, partial [Gammaproteobacteria bacterium]|nr:hypothetical protein [Gammaproteobacteria bacterium]
WAGVKGGTPEGLTDFMALADYAVERHVSADQGAGCGIGGMGATVGLGGGERRHARRGTGA